MKTQQRTHTRERRKALNGAVPGLTTLARCFHKYVRSNPGHFQVIESSEKSHRVHIVVLRDSAEPS